MTREEFKKELERIFPIFHPIYFAELIFSVLPSSNHDVMKDVWVTDQGNLYFPVFIPSDTSAEFVLDNSTSILSELHENDERLMDSLSYTRYYRYTITDSILAKFDKLTSMGVDILGLIFPEESRTYNEATSISPIWNQELLDKFR